MLKWLKRKTSTTTGTTTDTSRAAGDDATKDEIKASPKAQLKVTKPKEKKEKVKKPNKKKLKEIEEEEDEAEQMPEEQKNSTKAGNAGGNAEPVKSGKNRRRKERENSEIVENEGLVTAPTSTQTDAPPKKKSSKKRSTRKGKATESLVKTSGAQTKSGDAAEHSSKSPRRGSIVSTHDDFSMEGSDAVDHENDDDNYVGDFEFAEDEQDDSADFDCLSPEDILKEQQGRIRDVAELLNEQLLTRYFENPKAVLKDAGTPASGKSDQSVAKIKGKVECLVCGEEYRARERTALSCHHTLCNGCWGQYLSTKIGEGEVQGLTCPAVGCSVLLTETVVQSLVDTTQFEKYVRFVSKSFVEDNASATWCPRPNCGHAITADMVSGREVSCSCGYRFCFSCKLDAHSPASCEQVRLWQQKSKDDSETSHWVGANTKDCPRCNVSVEKNGGCMHMKCPRCTFDWCWLCLRPWKGHNDFYSCNRFEKAQKKKEKQAAAAAAAAEKGNHKKKSKVMRQEEEREKQKQQLERYLHYYERYLSHDAAAQMEKQIKDKAYQKIADLTEVATRAEVQFIEKGTTVLLEAHSLLKWSYVFAYYLPETGPEKELFNFLQQELEKTTEKLGEILEAPGVMKRAEATDLTKLAQKKCENMLRGVEHGLVGH